MYIYIYIYIYLYIYIIIGQDKTQLLYATSSFAIFRHIQCLFI